MSFLNTDIDFSMVPKLKTYPNWFAAASIADEILPLEFSWAIATTTDSKEILDKKKLITKPQHQYNCGSCFAMAVATCINDVFIVSGPTPTGDAFRAQSSNANGLGWNPMISTTYLMQNFSFKQYGINILDKCRGGNPGILLSEIEKSKGAVSERCVDYSWCSSNRKCKYRAPKNVLGSLTETELLTYLNTTITPKGCFFSTTSDEKPLSRLVYKIKNIRKISYESNKLLKTSDATTTILKDFIYKNGPIIMGFVVFKNWQSGNFEKTSGIYFYNGDYNANSPQKFLPENITKEEGKHAVVIVGWGRSYVDIDNAGNKAFVNYWHCRNTFGSNWGENGFFKYAIYPYNKILQSLGGYLTFQAGDVKTEEILETTSTSPRSLEQNEKFYRTSETLTNANDLKPSEREWHRSNSDNINYYFKILAVVGFFLLFLILTMTKK